MLDRSMFSLNKYRICITYELENMYLRPFLLAVLFPAALFVTVSVFFMLHLVYLLNLLKTLVIAAFPFLRALNFLGGQRSHDGEVVRALNIVHTDSLQIVGNLRFHFIASVLAEIDGLRVLRSL